ncbi:MAG: GNAT family N-acetyltransferase [Gemmatimonadota bacterium]|nr:GNAT family N-acetyltransferase [Gemmatimonadota bacterium]
MHVTIRRADPGDLERIVLFNLAMARETEGRELDRAVLTRGVRQVLGDPARGRYYVAEPAGDMATVGGSGIVGQLMVTTEWSDWRNGDFWWIQSVYVSKRSRGGGIYRQLHERVRQEARESGAVGLRLYVERDNSAAQAVYRALGLHESTYRMFEEVWA